jgi:predicted enzyme related to lactoylglutathione lyase
MGIRIGCVGVDTNDLAAASSFWQEMTGYQVSSSGADHIYLADPAKAGPSLYVQLVPEPPAGKNRLHIDLFSDDMEGDAARAQSLGATEVQRLPGDGGGWIVLADPDGNQFCIVSA